MTCALSRFRLKPPVFRSSALLAILLVFVSGCSTTGNTVIKVDASDLEGVQSLRQEITRMLDDLGYDWVSVRDPDFAQPVKAARHAGQWRMLFQARDRTDIRIDARFDIAGYKAYLDFHVVGVEGLDSSSETYYHKLRERLELNFGPDHVSDKTSFLGL
jgi:hypothetical protein